MNADPNQVLNTRQKHEIVDFTLSEIFKPERDSQDRKLLALIQENQAMGGTMSAFRHHGLLVSFMPPRSFFKQEVLNLRTELVPTYERQLKMKSNLNRDILKLKQALSMVIGKCRTLQDLRDTMPEVLVGKLPKMAAIPRLNPEGFVLTDKPAILEQFNSSMDLALKYQSNRLFD